FEVIPRSDDYETEHVFEIEQNNLILKITMWHIEGAVQLELQSPNNEAPNISFAIYVRGAAEIINYKGLEYLRFHNSIVVPNRFSYNKFDVNLFDTDLFPFGFMVNISVKPEIKIRFVKDIV
ncbi:MAG: hypothetical protein SV375_15745, partial [Thermodesulfobacteriota bacterium]|nr:hypothetical protein [Thermodesulfobacteriota bacterium]